MKITHKINLKEYYLKRQDNSPFIIANYGGEIIIQPIDNIHYLDANNQCSVDWMSNAEWNLIDWFPIIDCLCDKWEYGVLKNKLCPHGRK